MTKLQAEAVFREHYLPCIKSQETHAGSGRVDAPMRRQAWKDYTDRLCKGGDITGWQYHNWLQPRWLESSRI